MASKNKSLSAAVEIFDQEIEGVIRKIPLKSIQPSKGQPRQNKDINIQNLADSLEKDGLLQPILVTREKGNYMIIAGERRYRAAMSLNWPDIECRIFNKDEKESYKLAVVENLQRENLDPLEESVAYKKLKQQFQCSDSELSRIVGKSRNYISEILSIAEIPHPLLEKARKEGITSKNILIQFAQSVKKGISEDFIDQFQSGEISTVKSAKKYMHQASQEPKEKPPVDSNQSDMSPQTILDQKTKSEPKKEEKAGEAGDLSIFVQKDYQKNILEITIQTPPLKLDYMSISAIKKAIQKSLHPIIREHTRKE